MALIDLNRTPTSRDLRIFGALLPVALLGLTYLVWVGSALPWVAYLGGGVALSVTLGFWAMKAIRLPIYRAWLFLVSPLGRVLSVVVLAGVYYLVLTPLALVLRLAGRDALGRRKKSGVSSYFEAHQSADTQRYFRQF